MAIIADMNRPVTETAAEDRQIFALGLIVSLVLHGLLAIVLAGGISGYVAEPTQTPIDVEIVAIPVPLEEAPVEEDAPVEEEEAVEEEVIPEEQAPEEETAEEPETEEETAEEPETEEETAEPEPAPPPDPAEPAESAPEVTVLQPVYEFGEEDSAQRQDEAEEPASVPVDVQETEPDEAQEEEANQSVEEQDETAAENDASEPAPEPEQETELEQIEEPVTDEPATEELTAEVTEEETPGTEAEAELGGEDQLEDQDYGVIGPIATDATPRLKPAPPLRVDPSETAVSEQTSPTPGPLSEGEFGSGATTEDLRVLTEMRGLRAEERMARLCLTALRDQLTSQLGAPIERLPRIPPLSDKGVDMPRAAFYSVGRWFDVSFRCYMNATATRVERFSVNIGRPIPPSQWRERGLPNL